MSETARRGWPGATVCSLLFACLLLAPAPGFADESDDEYVAPDASEAYSTQIYGVIDAYWEKVAETPAGVDANGKTVMESNPNEFAIPNLSLMVQGTLASRYSYFLTIAMPDADGIDIRSAWVKASIIGDMLNIRAGKLYRKFGLYNEILDAVPTYMGIEPPELFDKDHLLLTRSTNLMIDGAFQFGPHQLTYALMTGNDERAGEAVPLGADLSYNWRDTIKLGSSFYWSGGDAAPSRSVGDGSPTGGVATWMAKDEYMVYGGYAQLDIDGFQLQTEFWRAHHDGKRDPDQVLKLLGTDLNQRQLERFGLDGAAPTAGDVNVNAVYDITTLYVRMGYAFELPFGELTPYLQYDFYRNPEAVSSKSYGGDAEAGLSDDGQFHKATAGIVYRPIPAVALKLDGSTHTQKFNGELLTYPEVRVSFSYLWRL